MKLAQDLAREAATELFREEMEWRQAWPEDFSVDKPDGGGAA